MRTKLGVTLVLAGAIGACSSDDARTNPGPNDAAPGADAASCPGAEPLLAEPSEQQVTFRIHGSDASLGFVLANGGTCDPFPIERKEEDTWVKVGLAIGWPATCGASGDNWSATAYAVGVPHDSSTTLTWDSRELHLYREPCVTTNGTVVCDLRGELQPVAPGEYRATLCFSSEDSWGVGMPGPQVNPACNCMGEIVVVPFTLPATGDQTVDVQAPAAPGR